MAIGLAAILAQAVASAPPPIIDMHLHARRAAYAGADVPPMCAPFAVMPRSDPAKGIYAGMSFNVPPCETPIPPEKTDEAVLSRTVEVMERLNIVGVVSGEPELMARWTAAAPRRIIPAVDYRLPESKGVDHVGVRSLADLRALHAAGRLRVIGEVMAQYEGVRVDDPSMDPLWSLAEELDVPVAIHMGPGEPGQPYAEASGYRASLGDPLLLEEVLVRHPRLRVSIMHAGYPMADRTRALLFSYPHVYVDIGSIVYTEPRPAFYAFLKALVDAGYGDRIMFGSDQMIWPGIIEPSVRAVADAPFLSEEQKRDIFYNNAARFLRLSREEIDRHHGR